jgi:hypothetical protein
MLVCLVVVPLSSPILALANRTSYDVPLVRLKVAGGDEDDGLREVQVYIDGRDEYAVVAPYNDLHVEAGRGGTRTIEHGESPSNAFIITDFEAEQINRAVESLIATLETFEKDLKRRRWGRCLYLDAFLPRFLKAFYFMVCAARNSEEGMPRIGRIPESVFDVSLSSPKSDARVAMWKEKEYLIKLRIITREFIYQLEQWQKKELENSRRNPEVTYSAKAEEAFALFVKMYFDIKAPPTDGRRQGL